MKDELFIESRPTGLKKRSITKILNGTVGLEKPRFYETDSLHELLCFRYALSRHTNKEKLIDLVTQELNI